MPSKVRGRTGRVVLGALAVAAGCALLVVALLAWRDAPSGALRDARLLVDEPSPSGIYPASAEGGGLVGVAPDGCVTVGGAVLVAPPGSRIVRDVVHIETYGDFRVGETVPSGGGGYGGPFTRTTLPDGYARCGLGVHVTVFPRMP